MARRCAGSAGVTGVNGVAGVGGARSTESALGLLLELAPSSVSGAGRDCTDRPPEQSVVTTRDGGRCPCVVGPAGPAAPFCGADDVLSTAFTAEEGG